MYVNAFMSRPRFWFVSLFASITSNRKIHGLGIVQNFFKQAQRWVWKFRSKKQSEVNNRTEFLEIMFYY